MNATSGASADPAVRFWLDFVADQGGLWEDGGDKALVILPRAFRREVDLPEEISVTAEPEVAQEDGALLLAPGHPALDHAAERVLQRGDVATYHIRRPEAAPPSSSALLNLARNSFVVDHGRIDLAPDPPSSAYLPIVRVGAVVTYWTSFEDRLQEQEEVWVDACSGLALADNVRARLEAGERLTGEADRRVLEFDPERAVAVAHDLLEAASASRQTRLTHHSRRARDEELARAASYYDASLGTIARRRAVAEPERARVLDAQAEATRAERARRLKEIEEKFEARHELRPFRLHLVHVPVTILPVLVRRGERTWPLEVIWVLGASGFLPIRCPHCGATHTLVAAKDRLGCRGCLAAAASLPARPAGAMTAPPGVPEPPDYPTSDAPEVSTKPKPRREKRAGKVPSKMRAPVPDASRMIKMGNKLANSLWQSVVDGKRWRARTAVPDSPMSALARLYGPDAPLCAVGFPFGELPLSFNVRSAGSRPAAFNTTTGVLIDHIGFPYPHSLRWRLASSEGEIAELLPYWGDLPLALPFQRDLPLSVEERLFRGAPAPRVELDPVAQALWDESIDSRGLPFVARCLALWWSIEEALEAERYRVEAVAQAVIRCAARRSGVKGTRQKRARAPLMNDSFWIDSGSQEQAETNVALDALLDRSPATW